MANARVTQDMIEVLSVRAANARVTYDLVEVLYVPADEPEPPTTPRVIQPVWIGL